MFRSLVQRYRAVRAYRPRHSDQEPPAQNLGPASYYTSRTGAWSPSAVRGSASVNNQRRYQ